MTRRIFTILGLSIFTFISCSDNKLGAKKAEVIATNGENNTETKKVGIATSDELKLNATRTYTKELDLHLIEDLEQLAHKKVGFIPLPDIYPRLPPLPEVLDSFAISNLKNLNKDSFQYFKLSSTDRKRFLSRTKISETDNVFVYDYSTDVLHSFSVRKLKVVAFLHPYKTIEDCPCGQGSYLIGFEINKHYLNGLGRDFSDALVFVGRENPFTQGQMKPIVWQKIKTKKFPIRKSNLSEEEKQYKNKNAIKEQTYLYETNTYQIFIKDYTEPNNLIRVQDRHLIVIDKKKDSAVLERMFNEREGTVIAPLNFGINNPEVPNLKEQWIGKLFKDKPDVIFRFASYSFSCPGIDFVNPQDKYVTINCHTN